SEAAELETIGLAGEAALPAAGVASTGALLLGGRADRHALILHAGAVAQLGIVAGRRGTLRRRCDQQRRDQHNRHRRRCPADCH
ncbi:unnamed protein product, partial [Musa acuminata subsp. malaccensis]